MKTILRFIILFSIAFTLTNCYVYKSNLEQENAKPVNEFLQIGESYKIKSNGETYNIQVLSKGKQTFLANVSIGNDFKREFDASLITEINQTELKDFNLDEIKSLLKEDKFYKITYQNIVYRIKPIEWIINQLYAEASLIGQSRLKINKNDIERIDNFYVKNGNVLFKNSMSVKDYLDSKKQYQFIYKGKEYTARGFSWNNDELTAKLKMSAMYEDNFAFDDIEKVNNKNASEIEDLKTFLKPNENYRIEVNGKRYLFKPISINGNTVRGEAFMLDEITEKIDVNAITQIDLLKFKNGILNSNQKDVSQFVTNNQTYHLKLGNYTYKISALNWEGDQLQYALTDVVAYEKQFNAQDISEVDQDKFSNGYFVDETQKLTLQQEIQLNQFYKLKVKDDIYKVKTMEWEGDSLITHVNFKKNKIKKFHKNDITEVQHRIFSRGRSDALTFGIYGGIAALVILLLQ